MKVYGKNINNMGDLKNNNFTEIKGKESMKEKTRSIIIIITFFIFLIIFTVLYNRGLNSSPRGMVMSSIYTVS